MKRRISRSNPIEVAHQAAATFSLLVAGILSLALPRFGLAQEASQGGGESVAISSRVLSQQVKVAEPFIFEVEVIAPRGSTVIPQEADLPADFEIVDLRSTLDVPLDDRIDLRMSTYRFTLECLIGGEYELPPIRVVIENDSGQQVRLTDRHSLNVVSAWNEPVDPERIRDLRPVIDVEERQPSKRQNLLWIVGVLLICGLSTSVVGFIVWQLRRRNLTTPLEWVDSELSLIEQALITDSIEAGTVLQMLSDRLRQYLHWEFGEPTQGRTLDDVANSMLNYGVLSPNQVALVAELTEKENQVRFGGRKIEKPELQTLLNQARTFTRMVTQDGLDTHSLVEGER